MEFPSLNSITLTKLTKRTITPLLLHTNTDAYEFLWQIRFLSYTLKCFVFLFYDPFV